MWGSTNGSVSQAPSWDAPGALIGAAWSRVVPATHPRRAPATLTYVPERSIIP